MPLRMGPLQVQAGVPSLVRLATAPWAAPLLDGRSIATRAGRIHFSWLDHSRTLALRCAPCTVHAAGLGDAPLRLEEVRITARRQADVLSGDIASGRLRAAWSGELRGTGMRLKMQLPMSPIADGYALLGSAIPELAQARIAGRFALTAQVSLPGGSLTVLPQVEGFEVEGLGTEALITARSACTPGKRASRLNGDSWLSRAVVAAEDQRFFTHPGYDMVELAASLSRNQREGRIERGGSTIPQQLAKLLVTGGERSPARKLRELLYAVEMERTLGKPRILGLYLAHAPWGDGICGAEAAARKYFGVRAHELTPAQAAWMAAMLHSPTLEAARWAQSGQINVARTQRIVLAMREMPRLQRVRLAEEVGAMEWAPR